MSKLPKTAFLFPGQGSQAAGMGKELAALYPVARETFDEADEALGYKLSTLCFEGPDEKLKLTEVTQPAILTVSVTVYRVLASVGLTPNNNTGHSHKKNTTHVAAGTIDFADAVRTVRSRGQYMQEAVPVGTGAMAAILMLGLPEIQAACDEAAQGEVVQPANINSPGQIVISGSKGAVERAAELCKQKGAKRAVMLPVSAPFHCALMQPAQDRLAGDLAALLMHPPETPVMCNVDAKLVTDADTARDALVRQVTGAVRWVECIQGLVSAGAEQFIEVGPGMVLSGLMKQIDKTKPALIVDDEASLQAVKNHFDQKKSEAE